MQYPFPYKNSSGDTTSGGSTNLDPTFNATTTDTLLVTGNSTFQGIIDAEIIVGTLISGSNFTGQESKAGLSTTSQKNTSTNNAAYAGLEAINNNNGTVGLYSYGSSHATRPTSAWLETANPLKVKGSTTSLFAGTNENLICSGTNVQLPFLTASRPVATDGSFNLVSASITGTGSTVLQTSPTLITPTLGAASATSLNLSGTLNCTTATATGVVSGSKFRGEENAAGFSASYQKNSNSAGSASIAVFNNADSDLSLSITGTTSSNKATISTDRPLEIISDSSITLTGTVIANSLSPSLPVSTNASKNLVSASVTGTGSTVLQTSPTLITPTLGAATGTSLQLSGLTASYSVHTDASKNLVSVFNTGSGNNVMSASPTFTGTIQCAGINGSLNWTTTGTLAARTSLGLSGTTSGTVTIACQNTAGTYNFNLPITSGSSGDVLTSAGGGSSAMTWTGSTGTGNLVRAAGPTLTGTLNCGAIVSTGTVSGTGYVGNSTGLASAGNIGEITTTAQTTALTNGIHYYTFTGTANTTSWADVVTGPTLTPGLYACHAQVYVDCQTANRLLQWNFAMGGTRCFGPWVVAVANTGYVSAGFTKIIRVTANQVITLQGIVNSAATLTDTMNCISITRIG
jgi:hypothetical protein